MAVASVALAIGSTIVFLPDAQSRWVWPKLVVLAAAVALGALARPRGRLPRWFVGAVLAGGVVLAIVHLGRTVGASVGDGGRGTEASWPCRSTSVPCGWVPGCWGRVMDGETDGASPRGGRGRHSSRRTGDPRVERASAPSRWTSPDPGRSPARRPTKAFSARSLPPSSSSPRCGSHGPARATPGRLSTTADSPWRSPPWCCPRRVWASSLSGLPLPSSWSPMRSAMRRGSRPAPGPGARGMVLSGLGLGVLVGVGAFLIPLTRARLIGGDGVDAAGMSNRPLIWGESLRLRR